MNISQKHVGKKVNTLGNRRVSKLSKSTDPDNLTVLDEVQAKKLFKWFKEKGFIVQVGHKNGTGYIAAKGGEPLLYWMIRDFHRNWILEKRYTEKDLPKSK
jgi:tRNA splicing endonuclease